jgi:hypothetical protein
MPDIIAVDAATLLCTCLSLICSICFATCLKVSSGLSVCERAAKGNKSLVFTKYFRGLLPNPDYIRLRQRIIFVQVFTNMLG